MGRATVCGTVSSLFKSGYPPFGRKSKVKKSIKIIITQARVVQKVRTLISCVKNENSIFSPSFPICFSL